MYIIIQGGSQFDVNDINCVIDVNCNIKNYAKKCDLPKNYSRSTQVLRRNYAGIEQKLRKNYAYYPKFLQEVRKLRNNHSKFKLKLRKNYDKNYAGITQYLRKIMQAFRKNYTRITQK